MSNIFQQPSEIVTEIIMSKDKNPWLIVEGESDEKILRERKYCRAIKILGVKGWENVKNVIYEYLKIQCNVLVFGLIDRDYREHLNEEIVLKNIILTDLIDIENMIFNSSALHRVFSEFASKNKIPKKVNGDFDFDTIINSIYFSCVKLGKLRIFCQMNSSFIDISFEGIEHKKFICDKDLSIDENKLIDHINGKNNNKNRLTIAEWTEAQLLSWDSDSLNAPQFIAKGHDVMSVLGISLKNKWGSNKHELVDSIDRLFRVAYSDEDLYATKMWNEIMNILSTPILRAEAL